MDTTVILSESYVSNSTGIGQHSAPDYLTTLGLTTDLHDHTARLSLDASYYGYANFYDTSSTATQFINNLSALGNLDVFPDHFDIDLRAFAQPVVTTNSGALNVSGASIPGSFTNSYGYVETPDLKFNLGSFASSKTMPSIGQIFFDTPPGTTTANTLAGIPGPENTTIRSVTEQISSGPDFEVLNWNAIGVFRETQDKQSLLSEKSGIGNVRYALSYEWSLLATGGYDALSDSIPLRRNVSGPVALGGIGLTLGQNFQFEAEAGERYNAFSFNGSLRYDISPDSVLTGSASDFIMTPQQQLLNNLGGLVSSSNGTLTSENDIYANGTASTLSSFSVQSAGNPFLSQFVARYQTASASLVEKFVRTDATLSVFGTRMTILTAGLPGPPTATYWGTEFMASRNLNPLLLATLGVNYTDTQEFGGQASIIAASGGLNYSLSRQTQVYLASSYITRVSSDKLQAFSPLSGSASSVIVTLGLRHTL